MKVKVYAFSTELITRTVTGELAKIPILGKERVLLTNPSTGASFPCCVVNPPLQKDKYSGAAKNLSFTVEAWADKQMEALRVFDEVSKKLFGLNMKLTNNTPLHRDEVTGKWRFGGYFDCRWNAITNSFERN